MKHVSTLAALALLAAASIGHAQIAFSSVSGTAGSVAARSTTGGTWSGITGSAATATITYTVNSTTVTGPARKFATSSTGAPEGQSLPSYNTEFPGGGALISGESRVTGPIGTAPTYYTASWSGRLAGNGTDFGTNDSGTFDPWDVRYGDLSPLVGAAGGSTDVYFQSGLDAVGPDGSTFLEAEAGYVASYGYELYTTEANGARLNLLSLSFSSATGLSVDLNEASGLEVYLLGANAEDPSADPDARLAAGTLLTNDVTTFLQVLPSFDETGRLLEDVNFGVRRRVAVLPGGAPDDLLFTWHTDTTNTVSSVPEPATFAALGLGLAAFARRRRRA